MDAFTFLRTPTNNLIELKFDWNHSHTRFRLNVQLAGKIIKMYMGTSTTGIDYKLVLKEKKKWA